MNARNAEKLGIEERRRKLASMLRRCKTQQECAVELNVDQTTISTDIKALRRMSQHFVYDLAKSDLASYYEDCIRGIDEVKLEMWKIVEKCNEDGNGGITRAKHKIMASRVIIQAEVEKFKLLQEGPSMMSLNAMAEKMDNIEKQFEKDN